MCLFEFSQFQGRTINRDNKIIEKIIRTVIKMFFFLQNPSFSREVVIENLSSTRINFVKARF